jgi:putative endonuclease
MAEKEEKQVLGKKAEAITAEYFITNGFKILEKNYRFGKNEIDIIAEKEDLIVFIEVKSKNEYSDINPELLITAKKQKSIFLVANYYVEKNKLEKRRFRFDVVFIYFKSANYEIKHFPDALLFL